MRVAWFLVGLSLSSGLSGCLEPFGLGGPAYRVERTSLAEDGAWNREAHFSVRVREATPLLVLVEATAQDGRFLRAEGLSNATLPPISLDLPDGTWTVTYYVDGRKWETMGPARVDATPPAITGLETLGTALSGAYLIGSGATADPGATVYVVRQRDGAQVGGSLPVLVEGLSDGVHGFDVVATDPAGNQAVATVQVRAGSAARMPEGQFTLGITSRYTSSARLWDITDLDAYASPAAARQAAPQWLGEGTALTPQDPAVQAVVKEVTTPQMTTGRAALELFRWLVDHADYDTARLSADDLLTPAQTMEAEGGVCRDLAALYASLLRGAGIPARLVTGYLGGRVGGFHAWVEFYGGDGHGPSAWVPVDVSPVDGPYAPTIALQAFGARLPNMLGLHAVTPSQEQGDWSHAAALDVRFPPDGPEPEVRLADNLTAEFREDDAVLCIDPDRLARRVAANAEACGPAFPRYSPRYLVRAAYVLDYGVDVESARPGTTIKAILAAADPAAVSPDTVETLTYGALFTSDPAAGTQTGTLRR